MNLLLPIQIDVFMRNSALLLLLMTAVATAGPAAQQPALSVPGMDKCVSSDSDDTGLISLSNRCTVPVEITWFYGNGNQGYATLAPGATASTGTTGADIPRLGVLRYFACPSTHPVIADPNSQFVTTPVPDYRCEIDMAQSSNSTSPKTFPYDVLTSGDCVLERGTLTFNANGEGKWRSQIHTNHTTNRDIWHVSFNVVESTGRPLFPVFLGDSPAMYGSPSPTIPWAVIFKFDPAKFRFISHISVRTSC